MGLTACALAAEDDRQNNAAGDGSDEAHQHGVVHDVVHKARPVHRLDLILEHVLVSTLLETHQVHPGPDAVQVLVVFLHVHGGLVELRITADAAEERQKGDEKVQHG